jgi:transposase
MRRYALRDDQWDKIKDILPGREGYVGVTAKDNRLFVEVVLYRYRAGIPWRDLPERFGDPIKNLKCGIEIAWHADLGRHDLDR